MSRPICGLRGYTANQIRDMLVNLDTSRAQLDEDVLIHIEDDSDLRATVRHIRGEMASVRASLVETLRVREEGLLNERIRNDS